MFCRHGKDYRRSKKVVDADPVSNSDCSELHHIQYHNLMFPLRRAGIFLPPFFRLRYEKINFTSGIPSLMFPLNNSEEYYVQPMKAKVRYFSHRCGGLTYLFCSTEYRLLTC